jgi:hypothetical protein
MPERYILDKVLKTGTLYRAEDDKYLVVEAAGTNSTSKGTLTVDGSVVLELLDGVAKLQPRDVDRFGPMSLGKNSVVVPPKKLFSFTGSSGSALRVVGSLMVLGPGEGILTPHLARFSEQPKRYYTYETGINGIGASSEWAADAEYTVIDVTCSPGERWTFDRYLRVERTGVIADDTAGSVALKFYLNDRPLDILDPSLCPRGVDTLVGHYYDGTNSYYIPVDLSSMPFVLEAGRNLKVKAVNISGSKISTSTGEEAKVRVTLVKQRELLT